jgi:hypothetical protein
VRETALAILLVSRSDAIPDLKGHGRTTAIFQEENFKPIIQGNFMNAGTLSLDSRTKKALKDNDKEANQPVHYIYQTKGTIIKVQ